MSDVTPTGSLSEPLANLYDMVVATPTATSAGLTVAITGFSPDENGSYPDPICMVYWGDDIEMLPPSTGDYVKGTLMLLFEVNVPDEYLKDFRNGPLYATNIIGGVMADLANAQEGLLIQQIATSLKPQMAELRGRFEGEAIKRKVQTVFSVRFGLQ